MQLLYNNHNHSSNTNKPEKWIQNRTTQHNSNLPLQLPPRQLFSTAAVAVLLLVLKT
jgi:hypothetical protein